MWRLRIAKGNGAHSLFGVAELFRACLVTLLLSLAFVDRSNAAVVDDAPPLKEIFVTVFASENMEGLLLPGHPTDFSGHRHIRVTGKIEPGDAQKLSDLLTHRDPFTLTIISFDSPGGDYREGLGMADVIHDRRAATFVGPGDSCLSACGLAFLGGTEEVIRQVLYRPNRYIHTDAQLGFHAPFNTSYPVLPTLNDQTAQFIADLFYGQAREAIRLLQSRIAPLSLNSDFVFDMLGKGPKEFLFVDRQREAYQNQITVVSDELKRPHHLSATAAKLACGYMLEAAISPAEGFSDVIRSGNWTDIADPEVLSNSNRFPTDVSIKDLGDGLATFTVSTLLAGRGPFTCTLTNASDRVWRGNLQGDIPTVPGRMGDQMDVTRGATFVLDGYSVLGSYLPWSAMGADDLMITGSEDELYVRVPGDLRQSDGPSFDCGGSLDPAAEIICRFPRLAIADATMVAVYLAKREAGASGLRDSQRAWLRDRDATCRPQWTSQEDSFELTLTGYCLLESTLSRINALLQL